MVGVIAGAFFWAFIAALVFIGAWRLKKIETIRHETARILIEKNPAVDSATLARVLYPRPENLKSGTAFRLMRVVGTIVVATGLGLWTMGLCFAFLAGDETALGLGGPATLLMIIGAGIFFAARFVPRPPARDAETKGYKSPVNGSEM